MNASSSNGNMDMAPKRQHKVNTVRLMVGEHVDKHSFQLPQEFLLR